MKGDGAVGGWAADRSWTGFVLVHPDRLMPIKLRAPPLAVFGVPVGSLPHRNKQNTYIHNP
jgi:hypothetical protein